jgi:autotransporter-associated beta strand protein
VGDADDGVAGTVLGFTGTSTLGGSRTITVDAGAELALASIAQSGGNSTLTKNGGGTLTLNGSASSFSGGLAVNEGTVRTATVGSSWTLGGNGYTGSGDLTVNGGSFTATLNGVDFNINSGRILTNNGGTLDILNSSTSSGSGNINGSIFNNAGRPPSAWATTGRSTAVRTSRERRHAQAVGIGRFHTEQRRERHGGRRRPPEHRPRLGLQQLQQLHRSRR